VSRDPRGPVVIDTGVFGARLTRRTRPLADAYRPLREGRPAVISFVTVAELRFGAKLAGWGPARLQRLEYELGQADIARP
jgi:predicted nucleic acid-binding protein